ncbi:hypothetical protein G4V62_06860 [Bacillaceae bacterium SIJ1]|uniref:hypothetical protein n=1 Tax=Litoribacterium kuwaitense TaxID=1398745 RepID=UPI0013EAEA8E|nr:hypothetical protein [Litoribacterium kuwaitense]NGP44686.1 hypothetical protein [Litoribacterium kuwaitense]
METENELQQVSSDVAADRSLEQYHIYMNSDYIGIKKAPHAQALAEEIEVFFNSQGMSDFEFFIDDDQYDITIDIDEELALEEMEETKETLSLYLLT